MKNMPYCVIRHKSPFCEKTWQISAPSFERSVVRYLVKRAVKQCSTDIVLTTILYTVGKSILLSGDPKVMLKRVIKAVCK